MSKLTDVELSTEAQVIKNEIIAKANTATRIGQMFQDLVDSKPNNSLALAFKGNYDISTNLFPANALFGFIFYTNDKNSSTLLGHDGGLIAKGSILIANNASGPASTSSNADWIIIPTQY